MTTETGGSAGEPDWVCTFCRGDADANPAEHASDCPGEPLKALRT